MSDAESWRQHSHRASRNGLPLIMAALDSLQGSQGPREMPQSTGEGLCYLVGENLTPKCV